jgi:predicted acylesterase/phospholipase RssA
MVLKMTTTPPVDRYCDIVMKGGITSGVVYPPAIVKLAQHYHFKNIGGTSAGAIAAALTAAAEYRRRETKSNDGFDLLAALPTTLGDKGQYRNTQLFRLFQPDGGCARLFGILTGSLNAHGTIHRIFKVLWGCVSSYWLASLASIIIGAAVWWMTESCHGAILCFLATLPIFVGLFIYRDVTRGLVNNGYGMCRGLTTPDGDGPALTDWLHEQIQKAAGLELDAPLTFGQLWKAEGGPKPTGNKPVRSIDLEMFTTNLSHGRPYMLPHVEPTARLFYRYDELKPYLPSKVMQWFEDHAVPYAPSSLKVGSDPSAEKARALGLKEIPKPEDFPVLLAARMSLSFPLLFAAVPLWAIDYEHVSADRDFKRCLFSDGGISSNFPMHLFDGLVPQWPTFGIDLEPLLDAKLGKTFMPVGYMQGISDRWTRFDAEKQSASRMGGFLISIAGAMQNWNDNTQARSAGVRDRVVRVRLSKKEGGMNLNMDPDVIKQVALRGGQAADELIARYLEPPPPKVDWDGWSQQRWARLDVLVYSLDQKLPGLLRALGDDVPHAKSYDELIDEAMAKAPPGHEQQLDNGQRTSLKNLLNSLKEVARAFDSSGPGYPVEPLPEPELRARSVL